MEDSGAALDAAAVVAVAAGKEGGMLSVESGISPSGRRLLRALCSLDVDEVAGLFSLSWLSLAAEAAAAHNRLLLVGEDAAAAAVKTSLRLDERRGVGAVSSSLPV